MQWGAVNGIDWQLKAKPQPTSTGVWYLTKPSQVKSALNGELRHGVRGGRLPPNVMATGDAASGRELAVNFVYLRIFYLESVPPIGFKPNDVEGSPSSCGLRKSGRRRKFSHDEINRTEPFISVCDDRITREHVSDDIAVSTPGVLRNRCLMRRRRPALPAALRHPFFEFVLTGASPHKERLAEGEEVGFETQAMKFQTADKTRFKPSKAPKGFDHGSAANVPRTVRPTIKHPSKTPLTRWGKELDDSLFIGFEEDGCLPSGVNENQVTNRVAIKKRIKPFGEIATKRRCRTELFE
jgi:hypothetical protein